MVYMYVLKVGIGQLYVGFTHDLKKRIREHKEGKVFSTKKYLPLKLVYYEAYLSEKDAARREKMIKRFGSTYVHLKNRISESIKESQGRG